MSTPTQEQIFADFLANKGRAGRLRRKLAANQHRNWMLALTLHSFARFAQRAKLVRPGGGHRQGHSRSTATTTRS